MIDSGDFEFSRFKFGKGYQYKISFKMKNYWRMAGYGNSVPEAWHDLMENIQLELDDQPPAED